MDDRDYEGETDRDRQKRRSQIIRRVQYGELSPGDAEREAAEAGLGPLESAPDPNDYDPMELERWSLPMAVSWISRRTIDAVRDAWNTYRLAHLVWRFREWRDGSTGTLHEGFFLVERSRATLAVLKVGDTYDECVHGDIRDRKPVSQAIRELTSMLSAGHLAATAATDTQRGRVEIGPLDWQGLTLVEEDECDVLTDMQHIGSRWLFRDIDLDAARIRELWPPHPPDPLDDVMIVTPEASGYIPLFSAAHCIATLDGQDEVSPQDTERWQHAYEKLLEHASSGQIEVSGIAGGVRRTIEPVTFAGCRVYPPFAPAPDAPQLSDELCLVGQPYLGEEP